MSKFVLIGGVTPPSSLDLIDKEIIKLTGKKNPKVLYIPTAGGDNLDYCEFFKGIYEDKFSCKVDVLFLVRETPSEDEILKKVFSSDVIYVEGGSVARLLSYLRKYGLDKMLKAAGEKGIVLAGKSAGAIYLGKYHFENDNTEDFLIEGYSDYEEVECLGFLDFLICPHFNLKGYPERLDAMIKTYGALGIALDNNCALEINGESYRVISTNDTSNAYKVYLKDGSIHREIISKDSAFRSMMELME